MTRLSGPRPILIVVLVSLIPIAEACQQQAARAVAPRALPPARQEAPAYDRGLTDAARVLAGLPPEQADRLSGVVNQPAWQEWKREFDADWTRATTERFNRMRMWRDEQLSPQAGPCGTLMYPFSGPDILNAYLLFPDCRTYVLFGLEHPGTLPALDRLSPDLVSELLAHVRQALGDLLARNYFITRHMMAEVEASDLHGNFPLMAVFLARLDMRIVSARALEIGPDGELEARADRAAVPALEVVFTRGGNATQTLVYFRAQAEDQALRNHPGVMRYLQRQAPFVTFLKSASYLLHTSQFSLMRDLLLARSRLILQDDSGVPYRFFPAPEWNVELYGRYQKPVKDFNYGFQPDLAKAYAVRSAVKPLTFSFGYHWETGSSTVMLAQRKRAG
jgi:hypothetical protein